MTSLDQKFKEYILANPEESKASARRIQDRIQDSSLTYQAKKKMDTTVTLHVPKFFSQADKKTFENISETMYRIFLKVIDAYKKDENVRKVFGFSPELEELIFTDVDCAAPLPILRVDIFYNEETGEYYFCEFNADGTSSMAENDAMNFFMEENNAWQAIQPEVEYTNLIKAYADEVLDIFHQTHPDVEKPRILITDFLENSYKPDLLAFREYVNSQGIECEIEDIRDLTYDGRHLKGKLNDKPYDLVYRRAVTTDILDHPEESKALVDAVKDKSVVFVGPFSTQVPHSKVINEALVNPVVQKYLTEEEIAFLTEHLPQTFDLNEENRERILDDKDKWIIKPKEGYGSMDVYPGVDVTQLEWEELTSDLSNGNFIVQQFVPHYKTENIDLIGNDHFQPYSNTTGLYVFNGKFKGILSRLSDGNVVSSQYNRRMIPTYFTKNE